MHILSEKHFKQKYSMKLKSFAALLVVGTIALTSCKKENITDYTAFVDPFIGTGGHGHTFPGPTYPHGMVQLSPDTRIYEWDAVSGYHTTDSTINGFSHTHLSGTGIGDYTDVLVMPIVGEPEISKAAPSSQQTSFASPFRKETETAIPGYYSVELDRYKVKAELAATQRAGFHKYTFPTSNKSGLLIDLDFTNQNHPTDSIIIEVMSDTEVRGLKKSRGWAREQWVYFYAVTSKPFTSVSIYKNDSLTTETKNLYGKSGKIFLAFETKDKEEVLLKVGISPVDLDGAKKNLDKEIPEWDFEKVKIDTRKAWNEYLAKIDIETEDKVQKRIFYTAMYHTAIAPNIFSDVDGRYRGLDKQIHQSDENKYTVFSTWDTMRALHPLLTIIDPEKNGEFIRMLLTHYQQGGVLPMWELAGNYTATMIGYNSVPIIVDAYMKGYRNFDLDLAYEAILKSSNHDTTGIKDNSIYVNALQPLSKKYKNEIGYVPFDTELESVAKGLEYAYQDWCILQMAKDRKDTANIAKYEKLATNYKNYFDPSVGFMRGKDLKGNWRTPFNPRSSTHREDDYCEGTAWQWLWFVPHQPDSLVKLLGGREKFIEKLDGLFTADSKIEGAQTSVDITGLIGQYAHGNEPSHHIIHFYNYIDQPFKTQELIDSVLYSQYSDQPDGLSGNEDCGQMSAWYILNSMGFYQVAPGNPTYSIGRPLFDNVAIKVGEGKVFEIKTTNNSKKNKYIESIKLNGKKLEKPFFTHAELMAGGKMEITMTDKAVK